MYIVWQRSKAIQLYIYGFFLLYIYIKKDGSLSFGVWWGDTVGISALADFYFSQISMHSRRTSHPIITKSPLSPSLSLSINLNTIILNLEEVNWRLALQYPQSAMSKLKALTIYNFLEHFIEQLICIFQTFKITELPNQEDYKSLKILLQQPYLYIIETKS